MTFWIREVAGWLLIALGLVMFWAVYDFCRDHWMFEAGILMVVSVVLFRGGIHLLKVAVAGRLCRQAQEHLYPAPPPGGGPRPTVKQQARRLP
jgi:hypothetical protein